MVGLFGGKVRRPFLCRRCAAQKRAALLFWQRCRFPRRKFPALGFIRHWTRQLTLIYSTPLGVLSPPPPRYRSLVRAPLPILSPAFLSQLCLTRAIGFIGAGGHSCRRTRRTRTSRPSGWLTVPRRRCLRSSASCGAATTCAPTASCPSRGGGSAAAPWGASWTRWEVP